MVSYADSGVVNQWFTGSLPLGISSLGDSLGEAAKLSGEIVLLAASILTGGLVDQINETSREYRPSQNVLCKLYCFALALLAPPLAEIRADDTNPFVDGTSDYKVIDEFSNKVALPSKWVKENIFGKAMELSKNEAPVSRYILSRLCVLSGLIAITVTKVSELALGLFLAALSLVTFGAFYGHGSWINEKAHKYLGALDVVHEIGDGIRLFINPQEKWNWEVNDSCTEFWG